MIIIIVIKTGKGVKKGGGNGLQENYGVIFSSLLPSLCLSLSDDDKNDNDDDNYNDDDDNNDDDDDNNDKNENLDDDNDNDNNGSV